MNSKGMLGIALLGILGACFSARTFADDSTVSPEEVKRLKAENAKLKKALERKNDDEPLDTPNKAEPESDNQRGFWGSVGYRPWMTTMTGDGNPRTATYPMISLNIGYKDVFFNISSNPSAQGAKYTSDTQGGFIAHRQNSFNIGYMVTNNFAATIGLKQLNDSWDQNPPPYNSGIQPREDKERNFATIGALYNHSFSDSPFSINATVNYGNDSFSATHPEKFTGTTSGNSTFIGYEISGKYSFNRLLSFQLFYRVEKWDNLVPTTLYTPSVSNPAVANLELKTLQLSGPGVGVSLSF